MYGAPHFDDGAAGRRRRAGIEAGPSGGPLCVRPPSEGPPRGGAAPQHRSPMRRLVAEIFDPRTRYEYELPLPSDIVRALELDAKFSGLDLGLVDGTVAAVAERRRIFRILTTDRRDFGAIRVGASLTQPLELLP